MARTEAQEEALWTYVEELQKYSDLAWQLCRVGVAE